MRAAIPFGRRKGSRDFWPLSRADVKIGRPAPESVGATAYGLLGRPQVRHAGQRHGHGAILRAVVHAGSDMGTGMKERPVTR